MQYANRMQFWIINDLKIAILNSLHDKALTLEVKDQI